MDFHEFILFSFSALADSGRGLAERAVALSWHLPVGSFRWSDEIGGVEMALSWHLPVGSFCRGDKIGGAEVALGMPLPDELQQESWWALAFREAIWAWAGDMEEEKSKYIYIHNVQDKDMR